MVSLKSPTSSLSGILEFCYSENIVLNGTRRDLESLVGDHSARGIRGSPWQIIHRENL